MYAAFFCFLSQWQDIAKEVAGEVGTLVKGVHRAGLIRGVLGYWKRDDTRDEEDAES